MNSRRKFLQTVSGGVGGVVFGTTPNASAKGQVVTILHGFGPPAKRKGIVGDFYIDERARCIYGPKQATGWGRPTSLVGPTGPAGPAGAAGTSDTTAITLIDGGSL